MSKFEIEKNIPLPDKRRRGGDLRYPFDKMEVGDSVFAASYTEGKKLVNAAGSYAERSASGKKFSSRSIDGGYRVWRIK